MRRVPVHLIAVASAAALLLAACGGGSGSGRGSSAVSQTTVTSPGMMSPGMSMGEAKGGTSTTGMNGGHGANTPPVPGAREVAVTARSFSFEPKEIRARVGEDLTIALTAQDVGHDFTIDELQVHVAAEPGTPARGGLRAASAGRFTYYCTVPGHRGAGMEGTLVVA